MSRLKLTTLILFAFFVYAIDAHGHSHDGGHGHAHDHGHGHGHDEPASFKWSRQANVKEDEIIEDDVDIDHIETIYGEGEAIDLNMAERHGHGGGHGHSHGGGGHGHSHGGGHGHSHGPPQKEPTPEERAKLRQKLHAKWDDDDEKESEMGTIWFQAISATVLISAAPFFILFFIPLDNSEEKQWLLKILLSFASGGLLGDAFLHLIPHAQVAIEAEGGGADHSHSHSHGHSHGGEGGHNHDMTVGLGVLSGIVAFLCVEKLVRIMKGDSHSHSHAHAAPKQVESKAKKDKSKKDDKKKEEKEDSKGESEDVEDKEEKDEKKEDKNEVAEQDNSEEIRVSGYLNLAADAFHNFTDGLAIGASFLAGESVGLITTFTILLHEVPHEIGDFAILIQSGVPKQKAIFLQLLTAVGAMAGTIVSLVLGGVTDAASSITLPFTAGGFIYIATVSVLPELLEGKSTFKQTFAEIIALLLGIYMMVIIAEYE